MPTLINGGNELQFSSIVAGYLGFIFPFYGYQDLSMS
jgi:hypothetical protein